jgi:hypothetical protein
LTHGVPGARDAAPKQRGVAAFAVAVSAANTVTAMTVALRANP